MCLGNNLYNDLCVCLGNLALEEEGDNSGRCSDTRPQCLTPALNIHTKSTKSTALRDVFTQIVQMALNSAQNRYIKGKYKKYSVSSVSTVFDA